MTWVGDFIHKLLGRDRYHVQANEVQNRVLRVSLLNKRLQVVERRVDLLHGRVEVIERRGKR